MQVGDLNPAPSWDVSNCHHVCGIVVLVCDVVLLPVVASRCESRRALASSVRRNTTSSRYLQHTYTS